LAFRCVGDIPPSRASSILTRGILQVVTQSTLRAEGWSTRRGDDGFGGASRSSIGIVLVSGGDTGIEGDSSGGRDLESQVRVSVDEIYIAPR
jgi:hypothetical protein